MKRRIAIFLVSFLILPAFVVQCQQASADQNAQGRIHHIAIKGFKFDPEKLDVEAGDTVVWTNEDIVPHIVAANKFKSRSLDKGESWSLKTKQKGNFSYICKFHPTMKAELIVN
jgi:plastocyanin